MDYGRAGLIDVIFIIINFWATYCLVVKVKTKINRFSREKGRRPMGNMLVSTIISCTIILLSLKLNFFPYHYNHTVGSVLASKAPISSLSAIMLSSQVQASRNFSLLLWLLFLSSGTSLTIALKLSEIWSLRFCSDSI